ncbi:MAG: MBL fold metallo-hydrolase [Thermoleophilia bacterium]|nr:MBL fold metallo-hydrolase [Thermoleophilia bacterium]
MSEVIQYKLGMANGFFVRDEGVIAVDSGCEVGREPFLRVCAEAGVAPEEIRLLVVTHGHVDHFLNMEEMRAVTGAPVMCHKNAEPSLRQALHPNVRPRNRLGRFMLSQLPPSEEPLALMRPTAPDIVVEGTVDLRPWGVEGRLVETFGHSDGCISVILDSGQAIVGDLLVEDVRGGIPSLAFLCYTDDIRKANEQIFTSAHYLADNAELFYSGHGGPFSRADLLAALAAAKAEAAEEAGGGR